MERLHPFDSRKFGKVVQHLQDSGRLNASQVIICLDLAENGGNTGRLESCCCCSSSSYADVLHILLACQHDKANAVCKSSVQLVQPKEATHEMLRDVHTEAYLNAVSESNAKLTQASRA